MILLKAVSQLSQNLLIMKVVLRSKEVGVLYFNTIKDINAKIEKN